MTYFVSVRSQAIGGPVVDARVFESTKDPDLPGNAVPLRSVEPSALANLAANRQVLLATHGFNVSRDHGARSLCRVEEELKPRPDELFLGLLWPGDFWLPAVNYPFEGEVAIASGRRIASFCRTWLSDALGISLVSHSLGARVVLETIKTLGNGPPPIQTVCVTAGAINRDCFRKQYQVTLDEVGAIATLSSREDRVLRIAYPAGEFGGWLIGQDDYPFVRALGLSGPKAPAPSPVTPKQIPNKFGYDHGDYLPPGTAGPAVGGKWQDAVEFMIRAFRREPPTWP